MPSTMTDTAPEATPVHPHTGTAHLREAAMRLAEARRTAAQSAQHLQGLRAAFEALHVEAITAAAADAERMKQFEAELRSLLVAYYVVTHEKKPLPGLSITLRKGVTVDPAQAMAWAKETGLCLTLDMKALEKIAVASPGVIPSAVVHETPAASIATDLDAALATTETEVAHG